MTETNDDPQAATGEDPVVESGKDPVVESGKASVAKKTGKVPVAETRKALVAETREDHRVAVDFENPEKLGNGGVEAAASAASSFMGSFQMFASEATDYSKKCLECGSAFVEKLRGAKSLESAIQIQSDYAKSAYAEFVAYLVKMSLVKMSDLYCDLFKLGSTSIHKAAAKIEDAKT